MTSYQFSSSSFLPLSGVHSTLSVVAGDGGSVVEGRVGGGGRLHN